MKIIFFSDAHGNQYAVNSFFRQIKHIPYDMVIFGGDVFGYYYGTNEIIDKFREKKIRCLLGNHDKMFLDLIEEKITESELVDKYGNSYKNIQSKISRTNIDFLYTLQSRFDMKIDGLNISFVHGSINDPINGRIYPDTIISEETSYCGIDYVFCGHTHHKLIKKIDNTVLINAGSIGQQRDGKGCSFVVFDTVTCKFQTFKVKYDVTQLEREIRYNETGQMQNKLIEVLYRSSTI